MTDKIIFYFHGLGSSPNTDKVARLSEHFPNVFAFPIDVDPARSLPYLREEIQKAINNHSGMLPVFVGTSLGGWYAAELAQAFGAQSVLINPAYAPQKTLLGLGVPPEICSRYHDVKFSRRGKYFIGREDDVINFSPIKKQLSTLDTEWVDGAGHRFNGAEFDLVIRYLDGL